MQYFSKIAVVLILAFTLFDCSNSLEPAIGTIEYIFIVDSAAQVRIEVENSYGALITTLVDTVLPQGRHSIRWEPDSQVLSGIYIIKRYENDVLIESVQTAFFGRN